MCAVDAKILIVEDDVVASRAMAALVARLGLQTVEARTLYDAMEQVKQAFDVICLDLLLPDGNGIEVLRRVRSQRLASKVAVISGADEPGMLLNVTQLKPEAIFGKPLDIHDFLDWLKAQGLPQSKS